jgi:hypothetical protein
VISPYFDWGHDRPPRTPYNESVIYEAHVRGMTIGHPEVPPRLRGTYAGFGHPAVVEHLQRLGVTAVELMPVHQFLDDHHLVARDHLVERGCGSCSVRGRLVRFASRADPTAGSVQPSALASSRSLRRQRCIRSRDRCCAPSPLAAALPHG